MLIRFALQVWPKATFKISEKYRVLETCCFFLHFFLFYISIAILTDEKRNLAKLS